MVLDGLKRVTAIHVAIGRSASHPFVQFPPSNIYIQSGLEWPVAPTRTQCGGRDNTKNVRAGGCASAWGMLGFFFCIMHRQRLRFQVTGRGTRFIYFMGFMTSSIDLPQSYSCLYFPPEIKVK